MRIPSLRGRKKAALFFFVLVVLWLPYMIWCFPGNMAFDSGSGIKWFLGMDRTNPNNPWFQNVLMGVFYQVGRAVHVPASGIAAYCILQSLLEAFLLSRITVFLSEKTKHRWTALVPFAFYAFLPVFPLYAFTMQKDSDFSIALLLVEYSLMYYCDDPDAFCADPKKQIRLGLAVVLTALFRNYAGWVPAALFLFIALRHKGTALRVNAAATAFAVLLVSVLLPAWLRIPPTQSRESMSLPLQTTAHYLRSHPDEITKEERAVLEDTIPLSTLTGAYDPDLADPIKEAADFSNGKQWPFLKMWLGMIGKHPGTMWDGFVRSTYIYYTPSALNTQKPLVHLGLRDGGGLGLDGTGSRCSRARRIVMSLLDVPVLGLFEKIGIYVWGMLLLCAVLLLCRPLRRCFLLCIPLLMVFAGCLLGPVNGYFRYAFGIILCLPAVVTFVSAKAVRLFPKRPKKA